jgi:hypothetical protein
VIECLLTKHNALRSSPNTMKKRGGEGRGEDGRGKGREGKASLPFSQKACVLVPAAPCSVSVTKQDTKTCLISFPQSALPSGDQREGSLIC